MKHTRFALVPLFIAAVAGGSSPALAQGTTPARPAPIEAPDRQTPETAPRAGAAAGASSGAIDEPEIVWERRGQVVRFGDREIFVNHQPTLRVWQDYVLREEDAVRSVAVVSGATTIDGIVTQDVVSVLGTVTLGPKAVINGSLVVVAGNATIAPGARIRRDFIVVGGDVQAPVGFSPGGEHVLVGTSMLGDRLRALVPWITGGLLLGRPVVPSVPWVWSVMVIVLIISLAINLLLHRQVGACADRLADKPFSTFFTGLLVLLLIGPASALLAISVVGVVVVPFLVCALLIAWMTGKVGVARAIGRTMFGSGDDESRLQALLAVLVGFVAIMLVYAVPFLGFVAWALVGVFGLGAAVQAFASGLRRERAKTPAIPPSTDGPGDAPRGAADTGFDPSPRPVGGPITSPSTTFGNAVASVSSEPVPGAAFTTSAAQADAASPDPFERASFGGDVGLPVAAGVPAGGGAATMDFDPTVVGRSSEERARALLAFPRARFFQRFAALLIDVVLVLFTNGVFDLVRGGNERGMLLLFLIYFVGGWAWKGTTIGGIVCNLRVAKINGKPLEFPDALGRGIAGVVSLLALGLGLLWVLIEPDRQGWHDKLTDTCVVQVPRSWPI